MKATRTNLILACVVVALCATSKTKADFTFGNTLHARSTMPIRQGTSDQIGCFSPDGLEVYISSYLGPGSYGNFDLWVLKRGSKDESWAPPENLGAAVNSTREDSLPSISTDGLTLYFNSNRSGDYDIYTSVRTTKDDSWGEPVDLGPTVNSARADYSPWISPDGLELYFVSDRAGGYGHADIYVAKRLSPSDPWGAPVNLGIPVNSEYKETLLCLSPDGRLLLFSDDMAPPARPSGYGGGDMWMARRASLSDPWETPVNLGPKVNGPSEDWQPRLSPEGDMLYFCARRDGILGNWQAPILPIVDFNGDGTVDVGDLRLLIAHWGTADTLYDIGPYAWGDGVVDVHDLKVFISEWERGDSGTNP